MGFKVERRPILAPGLQVISSGGSTDPGNLSGDVQINGAFNIPTEAVTSSTALQTLSAHGVSFITASTGGGGRDFKLPAPPHAGAVKYVYVDQSGSTAPEDVRVLANTTAAVFFGTTFNEAACAGTTANPAGSPMLMLVARNTTTWAVGVGSTSTWDFAASTGSTGQ
jgi:hypothetical protein